jgi:hypothetical protein
LTLICEVFRIARSTVYWARERLDEGKVPVRQKRGPRTDLSDEELLQEIRTVYAHLAW